MTLHRAFLPACVTTLVVGAVAAHAQSDVCADAPWVGPGTLFVDNDFYALDGPSSCTASRDAWVRYLPQTPGTLQLSELIADSGGSMAVYLGCPSGPGQELACVAFDGSAVLSLPVRSLNAYYIRVSADGPFGDTVLTMAGPPAARVVGTDGADGQYSTIDDALSAAQSGDTIYVLPGTYSRFTVVNKSLKIVGAAGPNATAIQGTSIATNGVVELAGLFAKPITVVPALDASFNASVQATNCVFRGVGGAGPVQSRSSATVTLHGCLLLGGSAGAYSTVNGMLRLVNCTIANSGAGVYHNDAANAGVSLVNCVIDAPTPIGGPFAPHVLATYSRIAGGWPGVGNISDDPQFVDPDGPDGVPFTADDDYRLANTSPCIDAGDMYAESRLVFDLDGAPRVVDHPGHLNEGGLPVAVDMGAYESQPAPCEGDLTGDGRVALDDLSILLTQFGAICN
ncbi:MAG: hypothetical protein HRF50_15670 [Phycisphaerae bacterium]|jgi:hypothetical protein